MASASEVRQLLKEYQSLTASSRAAGNTDPSILAQMGPLREKLAAAGAEGFTEAEDAAKDISSYETLINSKIAADEPKSQESTKDEKLPAGAALDPKEEIVPKSEKEIDDELRNAMPASEDTPGPTEQDVINTSKEPIMMTDEQKAAQEKEQADNRAKLRAEEFGDQFKVNTSQKPVPQPLSTKVDWRVRMSLAPSANYLYNASAEGDLLFPLKKTNGVVFPYTPTIQTGYRANYEPADIAHTNYKSYFYKNSSIEDISITADFTAQDTEEAKYLLAVMHFFKSVTKMFYGKDNSPAAGTPPPLVYLSGFGANQFDNHPMVITSFSFALPNDVDYVRTETVTKYASSGAASSSGNMNTISRGLDYIKARLMGSNLTKGGGVAATAPNFNYLGSKSATYVPSKIQLSITGYPIVSRRDISQTFSLEKYATGQIYSGTKRGGTGIW